MKFRNEEYIHGEKVLFYKEYEIDNTMILRVGQIIRQEGEDENVSHFLVLGRPGLNDNYGIEKTQDFEKCQEIGILQ